MSLPYNGFIELFLGPMFSGKTTSLLRALEREHWRSGSAKRRGLLIKITRDTRYAGSAVNHSGHTYVGYDVMHVSSLREITDDTLAKYHAIGVDELQFFKDFTLLNEWANKGKHVYAAAIDAMSDLSEFGGVTQLVHLCEKVTKLSAVCTVCGGDNAAFTKTHGTPGETKVGGKELYYVVCRKCYHDEATRGSVTPTQ